MKKLILALFVAVFSSLIFSSCIFLGPPVRGNGNVIEEIRDVGKFEAIKATRGVNVYITQGSSAKVVVKADENIVDAIETRVEKGVLIITTNKQIRQATSNKVYVTTEKIEKISAFAGSNVYSENRVSVNSLILSSSAGSNIRFEVSASELEVSATAGSNVMLEGEVATLKVSASAGSNVKAEDLKAKNCEAKAGSGANVYVNVTNALKGKASSGGNVIYDGNPTNLNISNTSGGNVRKR